MRQEGAVLSTIKTKVAHDHEAFFSALGYRPFERTYLKVLEG
jgi:hypothetical protein